MLYRSLARSSVTAPSPTNCKTCICSCDRRFTPEVRQLTQRRFRNLDIGDASPAVRRRARENKARALSRAQLKEKTLQDESDHNWHLNRIERATARGEIEVDTSTVLEFLNGFAELCDSPSRRRFGGSPVDLEKFQELVSEYDLSERVCNWIAHNMLFSPKDDQKVYGKKLIFALSFAGSEMATIRIMKQALVESKTRPAKLKSSEIAPVRKHLQDIAQKGENFRAMVLQGNVEKVLGDEDAAIKLWTGAMEGAVAHARDIAERKAKQDSSLVDASQRELQDHQDLEAPWIELSKIHLDRGELSKAKWAINIGCELDDPMVHYYAAHEERMTETKKSGEYETYDTTSSWLYHITKAAASGHAKASHELGGFYAGSYWRYIDDEPPDYLKPTAFDRFPPDKVEEAGSWRDMLREFFGSKPSRRREESENMFELAAFPYDPVSRIQMAIEWLSMAAGSTYAPSDLLQAQLYLRKTLWADAATPQAALDLTDERYTYASKADYHANNPIKQADPEAEPQEIPNPFYNPELAYICLRRVFYAAAALQFRMETAATMTSQTKQLGLRRFDDEDLDILMYDPDHSLGPNDRRSKLPQGARVYLWDWETREMYCDDRKGFMFDDTGPEWIDVGAKAKEICEEQGWDMYDTDGVLMYRHGLAKKQGAATSAGAGGRGSMADGAA